MVRYCNNKPDNFCYICGELVAKRNQRNISDTIKRAYLLYFQCAVGDQDKKWPPHKSCNRFAVAPRGWLTGKVKYMPFAISMVWRAAIIPDRLLFLQDQFQE